MNKVLIGLILTMSIASVYLYTTTTNQTEDPIHSPGNFNSKVFTEENSSLIIEDGEQSKLSQSYCQYGFINDGLSNQQIYNRADLIKRRYQECFNTVQDILIVNTDGDNQGVWHRGNNQKKLSQNYQKGELTFALSSTGVRIPYETIRDFQYFISRLDFNCYNNMDDLIQFNAEQVERAFPNYFVSTVDYHYVKDYAFSDGFQFYTQTQQYNCNYPIYQQFFLH